ncbi:MAG: hypothetical protein M0008_05580 [Actinomycetota bacterium]|nr:hypothetical protein [Actinomycetota bacterium]
MISDQAGWDRERLQDRDDYTESCEWVDTNPNYWAAGAETEELSPRGLLQFADHVSQRLRTWDTISVVAQTHDADCHEDSSVGHAPLPPVFPDSLGSQLSDQHSGDEDGIIGRESDGPRGGGSSTGRETVDMCWGRSA